MAQMNDISKKQSSRFPSPYDLMPFCLALVSTVQVTMIGSNTAFLSAIAAAGNIAVAIITVASSPLPSQFWRVAAWPLLLFCAVLLWAVAPEIMEMLRINALNVDRSTSGVVNHGTRFLGFAAGIIAAAIVGFRRGGARKSLYWIIALSSVNLLVGLLLREMNPVQVWGIDKPIGGDRFSGTLLNANAAACLFGMVALMAMGKWLSPAPYRGTSRIARIGRAPMVMGVVTIAFIGACMITGSRTAVTLLLPGLLILGLRHYLAEPRNRRRLSPALAFAGIAIVVAVTFLASSMVVERAPTLGIDAMDRYRIWQHYWQLAQYSPIWGSGLGSFTDINLQHLGNPDEARTFWYINDPHNVLLRILIEGGWPHLILIAGAIGMMLSQIGRHARQVLDEPQFDAIPVALAFALGCGMTDIALSVPAVGTLCALIAGLLWGRSIRRSADPVSRS